MILPSTPLPQRHSGASRRGGALREDRTDSIAYGGGKWERCFRKLEEVECDRRLPALVVGGSRATWLMGIDRKSQGSVSRQLEGNRLAVLGLVVGSRPAGYRPVNPVEGRKNGYRVAGIPGQRVGLVGLLCRGWRACGGFSLLLVAEDVSGNLGCEPSLDGR